MGQLRDSLLNLSKQVAILGKECNALATSIDERSERCGAYLDVVKGGADMLYQYFVAKFDKDGMVFSDHLKDRISDHFDSEIKGFLAGINDTADNMTRLVTEFGSIDTNIPALLDEADTTADAIEKQIAKKRKRLLKSKKFKAKISTYDAALNELRTALTSRKRAFQKIHPPIDQKTVDQFRVTPASPLREVDRLASISVKQGLATMKRQVADGSWVSRTFRENGDLKEAYAIMKQLAQEADDIELEGDPLSKRDLKEVKIFHGRTLLGSANRAVWNPKRPMVIDGIAWSKDTDPLDYLQQKITVSAQYDDGAEGNYLHDMTLISVKAKAARLK